MNIHSITRTASPAARRRRVTATALAAGAAVVVLPTAAATAGPPPPAQTHCPAGYSLLAISSFDPVYQDWLHTVIDVNANGWVCARQQPDAVSTAQDAKLGLPPGYPVYLARDDSIVS
jgi:hypothetical protein